MTPHPKDVIKRDCYTIKAIVALKGFNKYFYVVVRGAYVFFWVVVIAGVAAHIFAGDLGVAPVIGK